MRHTRATVVRYSTLNWTGDGALLVTLRIEQPEAAPGAYVVWDLPERHCHVVLEWDDEQVVDPDTPDQLVCEVERDD